MKVVNGVKVVKGVDEVKGVTIVVKGGEMGWMG